MLESTFTNQRESCICSLMSNGYTGYRNALMLWIQNFPTVCVLVRFSSLNFCVSFTFRIVRSFLEVRPMLTIAPRWNLQVGWKGCGTRLKDHGIKPRKCIPTFWQRILQTLSVRIHCFAYSFQIFGKSEWKRSIEIVCGILEDSILPLMDIRWRSVLYHERNHHAFWCNLCRLFTKEGLPWLRPRGIWRLP